MGVLQEQSAIAGRLDGLSREVDERFKMAADQDIQTLQRVCMIEEVLGITGAAGGESVPPGHFDGATEREQEMTRRPVLVQSGMEELRQQIYELRGAVIRATSFGQSNATRLDKEFGVEYESDPPRPLRRSGRSTAQAMGAVEIPKRQTPPPRVRKAAKMATPKPTPKRKR